MPQSTTTHPHKHGAYSSAAILLSKHSMAHPALAHTPTDGAVAEHILYV